MDQGIVLPILLVVQGGLGSDHICLCRGDSQFGIRNRFRGSQLEQGQLGFLQFILQGGVIQLGQQLAFFHLVAQLDIQFRQFPVDLKSNVCFGGCHQVSRSAGFQDQVAWRAVAVCRVEVVDAAAVV